MPVVGVDYLVIAFGLLSTGQLDPARIEPKSRPGPCTRNLMSLVANVTGHEPDRLHTEMKPFAQPGQLRRAMGMVPDLFHPATSRQTARVFRDILRISETHDSVEALEIRNGVQEIIHQIEDEVRQNENRSPLERGILQDLLDTFKSLHDEINGTIARKNELEQLHSSYSNDAEDQNHIAAIAKPILENLSKLDSLEHGLDEVLRISQISDYPLTFRLRLLEIARDHSLRFADKLWSPASASDAKYLKVQASIRRSIARYYELAREKFERYLDAKELEAADIADFTMLFGIRMDDLRSQMLDAPGKQPDLLARKIISLTQIARQLGMETSGILFELNESIRDLGIYKMLLSGERRHYLIQAQNLLKIEATRLIEYAETQASLAKTKEKIATLELVLTPRPSIAPARTKATVAKAQDHYTSESLKDFSLDNAEKLLLSMRSVALEDYLDGGAPMALRQILEKSLATKNALGELYVFDKAIDNQERVAASIREEVQTMASGLRAEDHEVSEKTLKVMRLAYAWLKAESEMETPTGKTAQEILRRYEKKQNP